MHEVLVNRLGGLSLPRKSVVRLTDRPDMTLDVYRGRKTTMQQQQQQQPFLNSPKDLDPSYKMDLDLWDCFGRKKTPSYNRRNTVCGTKYHTLPSQQEASCSCVVVLRPR